LLEFISKLFHKGKTLLKNPGFAPKLGHKKYLKSCNSLIDKKSSRGRLADWKQSLFFCIKLARKKGEGEEARAMFEQTL
jgi:hypothetical protein